MPRPPQPPAVTHLLRGSPSVRSWSRYQKTALEWTLCGIRRVFNRLRGPNGSQATTAAEAVSCPACRQLMATPAKTPAKDGNKPAKRAPAAG